MTDRWWGSIREKQHGFYRLGIWKFWNKFWWVLKLLLFQNLCQAVIKIAHTCDRQKRSYLSQVITFITKFAIAHNYHLSQLVRRVKIGQIVSSVTIIKSHFTNYPNCHKCSELSQLFKILTINIIVKLFKIVTIGYICQRKTGQHWFFHVWTSLNKCGQVWTSFDKFEQVWTCFNKFGQVLTSLAET